MARAKSQLTPEERKEKARIACREWHNRHPDYRRNYYQANKERLCFEAKKRRIEHADEYEERQRKAKPKLAAYKRARRETDPERYRLICNASSLKRRILELQRKIDKYNEQNKERKLHPSICDIRFD